MKARSPPLVVAVHRSPTHSFSKTRCDSINLLAGLGVDGDAHCGQTVKHRSRVRADPSQPNLRQVHLIQRELIEELRNRGFAVDSGVMGENLTTEGIDLLKLPRGSRLRLGETATIEITGLRNPCKQLDDYQDGLMRAVLELSDSGAVIPKAGVMAIVVDGGKVEAGDPIRLTLPARPHQNLERV